MYRKNKRIDLSIPVVLEGTVYESDGQLSTYFWLTVCVYIPYIFFPLLES